MASEWSIKVHVPHVLREYCGGVAQVEVCAASVRDALEVLERDHAALYRCICDDTGAVRRHVNLFINTFHVRDRNGLDTALERGDIITILPAVSGG